MRAASGDKIILTPYRITSISQVLGAVSVPGVIETKEVSALATGQSNLLSEMFTSQVRRLPVGREYRCQPGLQPASQAMPKEVAGA